MNPPVVQERVADPPTARLAPTLVLSFAFGVAGFVALLGFILIVTDPKALPAPFPSENQHAETDLYLAGFGLLLPATLLIVPWFADRFARGPNGDRLGDVAWALLCGLCVALIAAKASVHLPWSDRPEVVGLLTAAWALLAGLVLWRGARAPWPALAGLERIGTALPLAAGLLLAGATLAFAKIASIGVIPAVLGFAVAGAVVALYRRGGLPTLSRRWGRGFDALVILAIVLVVPDIVVFTPGSTDFTTAYHTGLIQFHQNFILGPAHTVAEGGGVLVDTASQYGVGPVYLLGGWFAFSPDTYGAFSLLDDLLWILFFSSAYAILRMVGVSRALAGSALGVAVIVLVLNLVFPPGALPQQGPLRFGLPMAFLLFWILAARGGRFASGARIAAFATLGIASVWAFEALGFMGVTFVAVVAFEVFEAPAAERLRLIARRAITAVAAVVATHLALVALTLILTGELPDWNQYLAFLRAFLFGSLGDLTYNFSPWSSGLPVASVYFMSVCAVVLLIRRHGDLVRANRLPFLAVTGMTAYGIALYSYFVDRSSDYLLLYVSMPALLVATLWLALLLRVPGVSVRARYGGLIAALAASALLVGGAWSAVWDQLHHTPFGKAVPGGESVTSAISTLWNSEPIDPMSAAGVDIIDRDFPHKEQIPILVKPDLQVEMLARSGRTDLFGLSDAWEDSFVSEERRPGITKGVSELQAGDLLVMDEGSFAAAKKVGHQTGLQLLIDAGAAGALAPLQIDAVQRLKSRFQLRPVERHDGFVVVRLEPRA